MKIEKNASFLADHRLGIFHSQKQVQPEPRTGKNTPPPLPPLLAYTELPTKDETVKTT